MSLPVPTVSETISARIPSRKQDSLTDASSRPPTTQGHQNADATVLTSARQRNDCPRRALEDVHGIVQPSLRAESHAMLDEGLAGRRSGYATILGLYPHDDPLTRGRLRSVA